MDLVTVFVWFCKQFRIMDIALKVFYLNDIGDWKYDCITRQAYFDRCTIEEYIKKTSRNYSIQYLLRAMNLLPNIGFSDLFSSERFLRANRCWCHFVKDNVFYQEGLINSGDSIKAFNRYGTVIEGTVTRPPKSICDLISIMDSLNPSVVIPFNPFELNDIEINGVKIELKYYIKRKGKVYGLDKG